MSPIDLKWTSTVWKNRPKLHFAVRHVNALQKGNKNACQKLKSASLSLKKVFDPHLGSRLLENLSKLNLKHKFLPSNYRTNILKSKKYPISPNLILVEAMSKITSEASSTQIQDTNT